MKQTTLLRTVKLGPTLWRLTDTLQFRTGLGYEYTVPRGFLTDGASTPRALWSLCPPMSGLTAACAVLHDFLYSRDCVWGFNRAEADLIFYEAMLAAGVSRWRAWTVYKGVRAGGSSSFKIAYSWKKLKTGTISSLSLPHSIKRNTH